MPDTLYHYCSTEAFRSIVSSASIRLSSLTQSNDSREGREISEVFNTIRERRHPEASPAFFASIERHGLNFNAYGFCLSAKRDRLSQWRGYADDANGVCIGFNVESLKKLNHPSGCVIEKVEYKRVEQERLVEELYSEYLGGFELVQHREKLDQKIDRRMFEMSEGERIWKLRYILKNSAFKEEHEWRLFCVRDKQLEDKDLEFFARRDALVPFYSVCLCKDAEGLPLTSPVITEVTLGPRNKTPIDVVHGILIRAGIKLPLDSIKNSDASYV